MRLPRLLVVIAIFVTACGRIGYETEGDVSEDQETDAGATEALQCSENNLCEGSCSTGLDCEIECDLDCDSCADGFQACSIVCTGPGCTIGPQPCFACLPALPI